MKDENENNVRSTLVALKLIVKMIEYQQSIDKKEAPTDAEKRHVAFLRAMRAAAVIPTLS